jgi:hydrogenase-4 membrane subunit HyfE
MLAVRLRDIDKYNSILSVFLMLLMMPMHVIVLTVSYYYEYCDIHACQGIIITYIYSHQLLFVVRFKHPHATYMKFTVVILPAFGVYLHIYTAVQASKGHAQQVSIAIPCVLLPEANFSIALTSVKA